LREPNIRKPPTQEIKRELGEKKLPRFRMERRRVVHRRKKKK